MGEGDSNLHATLLAFKVGNMCWYYHCFSFGKEGIVVSRTHDFAITYVVHDLELL